MSETAKQPLIRKSNRPQPHTEDEVEGALADLAAQNPDAEVWGEITPRGSVRLHIDQPGGKRQIAPLTPPGS